MTEHPITPPPELVEDWIELAKPLPQRPPNPGELATLAARWGADQELLACGNYLEKCASWEPEDVTEFYNYRRPKPPSLKEQALDQLRSIQVDLTRCGMGISVELIRRALEALPD